VEDEGDQHRGRREEAEWIDAERETRRRWPSLQQETEEKHNTKPCDQIYSETEQPPEKEERGGGFKKL
jgi:hypothetical protein